VDFVVPSDAEARQSARWLIETHFPVERRRTLLVELAQAEPRRRGRTIYFVLPSMADMVSFGRDVLLVGHDDWESAG
jgi:hypothetical protein